VAFIKYLQRYKDDRGALANLRGALSEARRPNAWPLLGGFPPAIGDRRYEVVGALWTSSDGQETENGCLADTCREIAGKYDAKMGKFEHDSVQSRFKRLLTCDAAEIVDRVVPVVRAAQTKDVRVNYTQLLSDLLWWNERTRVNWAKAFWGAKEVDVDQNAGLDAEELLALDKEVEA
jgi:CRISPR type I-E-associated protein CasB/Cse2